MNNYSSKNSSQKILIITMIMAIIMVLISYIGIFSPMKTDVKDYIKKDFLNRVSVNESIIENNFTRYIKLSTIFSNKKVIKDRLLEYKNQRISLAELKNYSQAEYQSSIDLMSDLLAAYRITDNKTIAEYGSVSLEKIKSIYNNVSDKVEIILTNDKKSIIVNSPIINDNGNKLANDIFLFDLSGFMDSINQDNIINEIIYSENSLKENLDQENNIISHRRILNTNYWLKVTHSKKFLNTYLKSILAKHLITYIILIIAFLTVFYKIISDIFKKIILKLNLKMKELKYTKELLKNLTNQVPGALFQLQSKSDGDYLCPYSSEGFKKILKISAAEEAKDKIKIIFSKIYRKDFHGFLKSIDYSKKELKAWHHIFRIRISEKNLIWVEGFAQPEKLYSGEILWHGYIKDITERKKAEKELELQYQFQKSLAKISSSLVNLDFDNFENKIDHSLGIINEFFSIDCVQVFKLSKSKECFSSEHEYCKNNINSFKKEIQNLSVNKIPWLIEQLKNRDYFTICNIEALPAEAKKDKKFFKSIGTKSAVCISIKINNELFGWYLFSNINDERVSQIEKIDHINIFAEVITRAITKNLDERKIQKLTYRDPLTGVYNRRFLEEEMKRLDTARALPISIIVADLNKLKVINDNYGHKKGDEVLIKASEIIKRSLRQEDILARLGGDEFAVLLPNTKKEDAKKIKERIKEKCQKTEDNMIAISIALGFATKEEIEKNLEKVFKKADDNMYQDKFSESCSRNNLN